jgi:uncharacterized protein YuzE
MATIKVIHDKKGETLTVYFEQPSSNQISEEAGDGLILIKNKSNGKIIGIEKLYFKPEDLDSLILEGQVLNH